MIVRLANLTDKPAWLALRRRPALSDQQHERHWLRMIEQRGQRMALVCVDVLFVIYLLIFFVSMKCRRKTGAGDRQWELYQASNDGE